ncbi:hypothetical protein Goari_027357 [Gossypium aridum]|uniref:Uncharacterized protein n=1 Tax=Gossypium aridum TaxID=34290 RepID=A0A7J8YS43_GOSAI|nr:hypothetical protein [Gossypium aridum]
MDKHLFRALAQYWNPAYSCFTFGKFARFDLNTFGYKEKGRCLCLEYLRVSNLLQSTRVHR